MSSQSSSQRRGRKLVTDHVVVLDACVLIGHIDADDNQREAASRLLAGTDGYELAAGMLTMAEVLTGPSRIGTADTVWNGLLHLGVITVDLPARQAPQLAHLRAASGLKMPGCTVLLLAQSLDAEIATFDTRLARAAKQHGMTVRNSD